MNPKLLSTISMNSRNTIYKVSDLTAEMRQLLERSYPEIWIEGELSSLSSPASGHLYFSLKDEQAQLRCAMFKSRASISKYKPKVGDLVKVRAKISVYTARGDLQCIVQHIEEAGEGLLQRRYEELKQKLANQGIFDQKYKKELPALARKIGVVTSPTGAAIRDVLTTLSRRCPGIPVTIYPALVQGDGASKSIQDAIRSAVTHAQVDVLILTRGGGSLEDLWCFNDEELANTIFNCPIPIVAGVGHEVDTTIADLVADLRAATPTAAAEMVSPDRNQLFSQLMSLQRRLEHAQLRYIQNLSQRVDMTGQRLRHPHQRLQTQRDNLNQLSRRLKSFQQLTLKRYTSQTAALEHRLKSTSPENKLKSFTSLNQALGRRLFRATTSQIDGKRTRMDSLGGQLNAVSPLATLQRGFSIARDEERQLVRSSKDLCVEDTLEIEFAEGSVYCQVNEVVK